MKGGKDMGASVSRGWHPPEQCVRGRKDCRSLAQVVSENEPPTFVCCGEFMGDRSDWPDDAWKFCHRSLHDRDTIGGVDIEIRVDRRDIAHMAGILSMALAIVMPTEGELPEPEHAQ
jgi:hypothetical protein